MVLLAAAVLRISRLVPFQLFAVTYLEPPGRAQDHSSNFRPLGLGGVARGLETGASAAQVARVAQVPLSGLAAFVIFMLGGVCPSADGQGFIAFRLARPRRIRAAHGL